MQYQSIITYSMMSDTDQLNVIVEAPSDLPANVPDENTEENNSNLVAEASITEEVNHEIKNDIDITPTKSDNNTSLVEESQEDYVIPDDISHSVEEGPAQPVLDSYPRTSIGGTRSRSFCANWYTRFPWLEYSVSQDKVYCFACRHFGNVAAENNVLDKATGKKRTPKKSATIYATTGFSRWAKAHERMQRHNTSARHLEAMNPWLEQTLQRENQGGCPTNGTTLLATNHSLLAINNSNSSSVSKTESPLPSKRKRSRPTKKTLNNVYWCTCTKCHNMMNLHECVCCSDVPEIRFKINSFDSNLRCITEHPGFNSVCLDHWSLQVAYYQQKQDHGEPTVREKYERYRYMAYCQFVRWCWGFVQHDMHIPLPSCVVNQIKIVFHSESGSDHPSLEDPLATN